VHPHTHLLMQLLTHPPTHPPTISYSIPVPIVVCISYPFPSEISMYFYLLH
jgi:hypothetical protein